VIRFLILFLISIYSHVALAWVGVGASVSLTPEIQTILNNSLVVSEQLSPDSKSKATLYRSNKSLEEGEIADEVLKITSLDGTVWLYEGYGMMFDKFKFISDNQLIITMCSSTVCGTLIFDNKKNMVTQLGGGEYTLVDNEQIKLSGAKLYDDLGAFWISKVIDYQGNLIKVLSGGSKHWKCIPLKSILNSQTKDKHPKLRQSMDDCIYVDR
jgi:hypothetical protein